MHEKRCNDDPLDYKYWMTDNIGELFEPSVGREYSGRGAIHLRWNHKYGLFSKAWHDNEYLGK